MLLPLLRQVFLEKTNRLVSCSKDSLVKVLPPLSSVSASMPAACLFEGRGQRERSKHMVSLKFSEFRI